MGLVLIYKDMFSLQFHSGIKTLLGPLYVLRKEVGGSYVSVDFVYYFTGW